ncbi:MAG: NAD(P)-dependent oxidoreductase [Sphingomonadaceae bacterium]
MMIASLLSRTGYRLNRSTQQNVCLSGYYDPALMNSLPLFHQIAGKPVLVLGNGAIADAKARLVSRAGGSVITNEEMAIRQGANLAFIVPDHQDDAREIVDRLHQANMLVNVADRPDLCDFLTPSILERDPVLVAIGTGGTSAGLAKHIRLRLETIIPPSLGSLARKLAGLRPAFRKSFPQAADRRKAIDHLLEQGGPCDILDPDSPQRLVNWQSLLAESSAQNSSRMVEIHISGDDPDDLTLKQARLLGIADHILHDADVSADILNRARADATRDIASANPIPLDGLTVHLVRI